jgi:hypothetical protein
MSSDSVVLPLGAGSGPRVPWTSSVALSRFVCAVQLGVGVKQWLPTRVMPRCFECLDTEIGYFGQWERGWSSRVEFRRGDVGLALGVCS